MQLARNMAAAMANSVVVVLINLVALPFYIRFLGMEAYGLIGFYATLQTMFQVLDLGLAPTVSREIAHGAETGQQRRSASLLRTLGIVYSGVALAIAMIVAIAAPWIGAHWLKIGTLPESVVTSSIMLIGLNLACRWPISLYHGALIGAHRLALSAVTSMAVNVCAATVTVAALAWGVHSVQVFFLMQAIFGLIQVLVLREFAQRAVGERDTPRDFSELRRMWGFASWMSGLAITSIVYTQLDKILLSRLISLESFGFYALSVLLVSGLQVLVGPTFNVIYPKFTTLHARGDVQGLAKFYSSTSRVYAAAIFSLALALALHVHAIVILWIGRVDVADHVAPLVIFLVMGSALNGIMNFPYALQLASGNPRIPFKINLVLLAFEIPTVVWLATSRGAIGGAMSWALIEVVYVFIGTLVTGRNIASFAGFNWLARDVGVPGLLALVPAVLGVWFSCAFRLTPLLEVLLAALAACIGIAGGLFYSPSVLRETKNIIRCGS